MFGSVQTKAGLPDKRITLRRPSAEMVGNSSNRAFDVISKRVTEGLEELKQRAQKPWRAPAQFEASGEAHPVDGANAG